MGIMEAIGMPMPVGIMEPMGIDIEGMDIGI
jgi:hypothetical protein